MNIIVVPPADLELHEAVDYYNDQLEGLGEQFYDSFFDTVRYIAQTPDIWRKIGSHTRRVNIKRFPYLIVTIQLDNHKLT